jgi:hypothetical protein
MEISFHAIKERILSIREDLDNLLPTSSFRGSTKPEFQFVDMLFTETRPFIVAIFEPIQLSRKAAITAADLSQYEKNLASSEQTDIFSYRHDRAWPKALVVPPSTESSCSSLRIGHFESNGALWKFRRVHASLGEDWSAEDISRAAGESCHSVLPVQLCTCEIGERPRYLNEQLEATTDESGASTW